MEYEIPKEKACGYNSKMFGKKFPKEWGKSKQKPNQNVGEDIRKIGQVPKDDVKKSKSSNRVRIPRLRLFVLTEYGIPNEEENFQNFRGVETRFQDLKVDPYSEINLIFPANAVFV